MHVLVSVFTFVRVRVRVCVSVRVCVQMQLQPDMRTRHVLLPRARVFCDARSAGDELMRRRSLSRTSYL